MKILPGAKKKKNSVGLRYLDIFSFLYTNLIFFTLIFLLIMNLVEDNYAIYH